MYNARLYSESNQITKKYTHNVLDEYKFKIKWKNQKDRAIDIGCGDGGVTVEILRRYMPENYELLVGCDMSREMVEHASRRYGDHRTKFLQLDIADDYMPDHLVSSFDHVFSFFTFNWIQNYSKAFNNTYKLLKEGGDCLILLVGYSPVFAAHRIMAKMEKWRQYMGDVEKYLSPFHDSLEPDAEIKKVMVSSGFENVEVSYKKVSFTYSSMESMTNLMTSINPFVKSVPKELINEFVDTYMHLICTVGLHEEEIPPNPEPIYKDFVLITAYGKK